MKIKIYQTSPIILDVKGNLEDIIEKIHQGRKEGAELIVFPELALTGYFVGPSFHKAALRMDSKEITDLAAATKNTAAIIGFIEESPSMNFYNSALVAVDGKILFAYRKLNLPNYGVFEERKMFATGKQVPVFKLKDFTFAVFICNDLWHPSLPYLGVTQKADIFISIFNSSQGSMGTEFSNIESWEIINKFYSRIFGIYNITANRVGEETQGDRRSVLDSELAILPMADPAVDSQKGHKDGSQDDDPDVCGQRIFRFWGGSEIINPFGQSIAKAPLYEPAEITGDVERDLLRKKKILLPYLRSDDPYFTLRELQRILYSTE